MHPYVCSIMTWPIRMAWMDIPTEIDRFSNRRYARKLLVLCVWDAEPVSQTMNLTEPVYFVWFSSFKFGTFKGGETVYYLNVYSRLSQQPLNHNISVRIKSTISSPKSVCSLVDNPLIVEQSVGDCRPVESDYRSKTFWSPHCAPLLCFSSCT